VTRTGFASSRTARQYDSQLWLEHAALGAALALAQPGPDDRVLDVATGTGALLRRLAERPDRPRRLTGIDASAAMLAQVPPLPAGWTLVPGDARRLPLADASVDLVTCAYLIHLLDEADRRAVLAEIARVLAPAGRVVLVSLLLPRGLLGRSVLAPAQRALGRGLGRASGWRALDPTPELAGAGLRVRRTRVVTRGYASLCLLAERA
jgi:ubiquinone/menaquinone biosynthesis C-methylase UbiE